MVNKERIVHKFIEYVQRDSETGNEGKFSGFLVKEMKSIGMKVWTDSAGEIVGSNGNNVYGYLEGNLDIEPILFSSHMDTVKPGVGIKPIIKDSVIYSSENTILGSDDKSGVNAILEAIRMIKENNLSHGPIEVVFTICEEGGLRGSKNLEYNKIKSKKAFVFDSSGEVGKIIVQAPAQDKINVKVIGKPSHAGVAPEEGISAIQVASEAITNMKLLRIDEETTANVGVFNGGKVTNIICPEVEIVAETRSLNNEKLRVQSEHMIECFKKASEKYGAKLECEVTNMYKAFKIEKDDNLVKTVENVCNKLGIKSNATSTGGGSDANIYNYNGIKAINLGTGMSKAHTLEEHITIQSLIDITNVALGLMLREQ
ncbi:M20/M25/M40 family metallo-hydrolase [Crassaminicella profunda]|uniref:M20/M25/M40 family metallo-hydrolase n=1 Tax=Crassaminicella profunda TaxID=1286698 RepID=UPI001CA6207E|nr:M20/M25/M40 family metallo-hydrolase [Crassaminicella profunda]QZY56629.1 M20/M25/M40 family metallo-hydrolase [Crassaminicella profunda]